MGTNRNETKQLKLKSLTCRYCQKQCLNAEGLGIHVKRTHESNWNPNLFECTKCISSFRTESTMKNHQKSCKGGATNGITKRCLNCNKEISSSNFARHSRTCRSSKQKPHNSPQQSTARTYRTKYTACPNCQILVSATNLARHRRTCTQSGE